ncbi:MAG TPA: universal stress protein [Dissulfurispiraceae bacterium]|nr:universal stress protein [Dissulfurispiraceae bacterium]
MQGAPPFCPVSKLEKLLLATDRSEFSEGAVCEAINFAKKCSSKLYVISVLETNPEYETIGSQVFDKEKEEVLKYLESIKARAAGEGLNCETIFYSGGEVYKHIVGEAVEKSVDMIVVGRRGRKGLAKLLIGTVAAKVIGFAPCKVLVVPRAAKIGYQKILVATDGSEHSIAAAAEAIGIARRCGSSVLALSSGLTDDELKVAKLNTDNVIEIARKEGIPAEAVIPRGRPYEAIIETACGRGVDLIVMGVYGKTGLKKIFMGSSTEKIVGLAGCAVMVVTA